MDLSALLYNATAAQPKELVNATELAAVLKQVVVDVDSLWMLLAAFMVFSMQIGFALVEAGSILSNLRSILMKNTFDVCLSTLSWWCVGYGIAYGRHANAFIGIDVPFHFPPDALITWFVSFSKHMHSPPSDIYMRTLYTRVHRTCVMPTHGMSPCIACHS